MEVLALLDTAGAKAAAEAAKNKREKAEVVNFMVASSLDIDGV